MSSGNGHFLTHRQAGLSLLEVVVSLALLGTLAVMLLSARVHHLRQWRLATERMRAVEYADQLLNHWSRLESGIPRDQWGDVSELSSEASPADVNDSTNGLLQTRLDFRWRTQLVWNESADALDADVIRLEIFSAAGLAERPDLIGDAIVVVEVLALRPSEDGAKSDLTEVAP